MSLSPVFLLIYPHIINMSHIAKVSGQNLPGQNPLGQNPLGVGQNPTCLSFQKPKEKQSL